MADAHEKKRLTSAVCGMALYCAAQRLRPRRLPWGVMTGIRPAKPIRQLLCAGKPEEEILSYMQNLYGASEQKLRLALEVAKNELSLIAQNGKDDIGLYIGIPFCPTRCLYCSFGFDRPAAHEKICAGVSAPARAGDCAQRSPYKSGRKTGAEHLYRRRYADLDYGGGTRLPARRNRAPF